MSKHRLEVYDCIDQYIIEEILRSGYNNGGSITVPLNSCLTGLDYPVLQIKTKIVNCHTAYSKPVKQEANGTVILPPFSIPC